MQQTVVAIPPVEGGPQPRKVRSTGYGAVASETLRRGRLALFGGLPPASPCHLYGLGNRSRTAFGRWLRCRTPGCRKHANLRVIGPAIRGASTAHPAITQ
jgi:hypothetical protein